MEKFTANLGKAEIRQLNGRDYLVAPVTLLVPGVLNGSKGPLYYPPDEIERSADVWNGVPLVLDHPTMNGRHVSARNPEVLEKYGLGWLFNAQPVGNKLAGEAWFDIEKANQISPGLTQAIRSGQKTEVSTGVFTENEDAHGTYNGVEYVGIARNYRADHLAILLDKTGACSIQDGCGVLNSQKGESMKLNPKQRIATVNSIVANCDCWQEGDKKFLNALPDEKLISLNESAKRQKKLELVANASFVTDSDGNEYEWDQESQTWNMCNGIHDKKPGDSEGASDEEGMGDEEEEEEQKRPMGNSRKPLTEREWMAQAPPAIRNMLNRAKQHEKRERQTLIEKLTANVSDDRLEDAQRFLANKSLEELQYMADLFPAQSEQNPTVNSFEEHYIGNYAGANGAGNYTGNRSNSFDAGDVIGYNYADFNKPLNTPKQTA